MKKQKEQTVTNGQIFALVEGLKDQIQLLAEGQTALGESLRSEIHGVRSELREFKSETNERFASLEKELHDFKGEMYDFRDEMYDFRKEMYDFRDEMYDFRKEMYDFRDEMYDFRDKTKENFATLFEYGGNVAQEEEKNARDIADHEQRLCAVEKIVLHDVKA